MKQIFTLITISWLFFWSLYSAQAQRTSILSQYLKSSSAIERAYRSGNYEQARKLTERQLSKSKNNIQQAWLYGLQARNHEALGQFDAMKEAMQMAEQLWQKESNRADAYALSCLLEAEVYMEYGNLNKAFEAWQKAAAITLKDPLIATHLQEVQAYWQLKSLEANEAYQLAQEAAQARQKQLDKQVRKVSARERRYLKHRLAQDYTLQARAMTIYGDYERADSLLNTYNRLVRRLAGVTDIDYAAHLIAWGENYDAQEDYYRATQYYKMAKRANEYYYFAFRESSKTFLRLQEGITRNSIMRRQLRILQNANLRELKNLAKKYYSDSSVYYIQAEIIDIERDIQEKRYSQAEQRIEQILNHKQIPEDHPLYAQLLTSWIQLYTQNDVSIEKAEQLNEQYRKVQAQRLHPNTFAYQRALLDWAAFHINYGEDFMASRDIFENTCPLNLFKQKMHFAHQLYPEYSRLYAEFFLLNDNYAQATATMKQAVDRLSERYGDRHIKVARARLLYAETLQENGEFRSAENQAQEALRIIQKTASSQSIDYALGLMQAAKIYAATSNYVQATNLLNLANAVVANVEAEEQKKLQKQSKKQKKSEAEIITADYTALKAASIEELAAVYARLGNFQNTLQLLEQALDNKQKKYGEQSRRLIRPHQAMAEVLLIKGDYLPAQQHIEQAISLAEKSYGTQSLRYAYALMQQARFHIQLGDLEKANEEAKLIEDIQKSKLGRLHIRMAEILSQTAIISYLQQPEQFEQTEKNLLEAIGLVESTFGKQHPLYADLITSLAIIYQGEKRYTQAETLLQQAQDIYTNKFGKEHYKVAQTNSYMGSLNLSQKNYEKAKTHFIVARNLYEHNFGKEHPEYIRQLSQLARLYYLNGQIDSAATLYTQSLDAYLVFIEKYFPALSEREKAKYWNNIQPDFEIFKTLVAQLPPQSALHNYLLNYTLSTKALLLNASQKVRQQLLNNPDESTVELFKKWTDQKEQLAAALNLSQSERQRSGINLLALESSISRIEKELAQKAAVFNQLQIKQADWTEVSKRLQAQEAAIEIIRVQHFDTQQNQFTDSSFYLVYLILPNQNQPLIVRLDNGNHLEGRHLNYYRNTTRFKLKDRYSYGYFWQPIEMQLPGNTRRIYLSPDGVYNQINVAALYSVERNDYVFDRYEILYISNSREIAESRKPTSNRQDALVVGNPDFAGQVAPLPGAEQEAILIKNMLQQLQWQVQLLVREQATESQIKQMTSAPRILHLATHGYFSPNMNIERRMQSSFEMSLQQDPMFRSGLLFKNGGKLLENSGAINQEDGILTAYEAQNLALEQTDLVVLSACETGLGELQTGEGVYGLQRAFLVAGARNLIMSLFKVNDEATQKLMTYFYEKYLQEKNVHRAFRQAQMKLRSEYEAPYYWGSFVLIGLD